MATLGTGVLTLADWAKRQDPDGKMSAVAELLSQQNEILDDMLWMEGNLPTGHRVTVRTGLPTVAWRLLNNGVAASKSSAQQIDEACGMLESFSSVDAALADLNGNTSEFRLSEAQPFLEAMVQEFAQTFFYGNSSTAPEEFTGLSTRYSSLSGNIAQNVLDGGGAGADNSSIWLVGWGPNTVSGIYPKGSQVGISHEDLGKRPVETAAVGVNRTLMMAYLDHWKWQCGVMLKDWRYAVRIANIDISNLVAKSSAADLFDLMIKAIHRIPNLSAVKPTFYMNRTVFQMLHIQGRDDGIAGGGLKVEKPEGSGPVRTFLGIPVKIVDQLTEAEAAVS